MNVVDFFNSAELELPGSWDTYPGAFEEFIAEIFANYQTNLSALSGSDYLTNRVSQESAVATLLCAELKACFEQYLLGQPPKAYETLKQVLQSIEPSFKAMYTGNNVAGALTHLYRIRLDKRPTLSPEEIFHIPFEARHNVATFRYSIPGLPCLYLGGSAYVCWEECGRPALDSFHLARFQPASGCSLQLLDFGWRPAQMAALIDSGQYQRQLSGQSDASDLVVAHALCWPLIAVCSIKVRHPGGNFKPEYIIPQLLLQWLTNETKIDGVRYFTTKASRYFDDPVPVANFAFPVRTTKPSGYCYHLATKFELSNPVFWPKVGPTAPAVGCAPHTNFTISTPTTHFNQTELGRLQHCAAALPCAKMPMKIAILGWGSLIQEPRGLPISGEWQPDGPKLWIEFSRISQRGVRAGCLTLVIDESCESEVTTLYALSQHSDLPQTIADLQTREGTSQDNISFCETAARRFAPDALRRHPKSCERIRAWAQAKGFDAVIWTALAPRFKDAIGIPFSPTAALDYLNGLPEPTKRAALAYIHNAPEQTMTPFRRLLLAQPAKANDHSER